MKYIALLLILSLEMPAVAMIFTNQTNEPKVVFTLSVRNRKNTATKQIDLPAMSRKNQSYSEFQRANQMSEFSVQVAWNSGALFCGRMEGDTDNFQVLLWRDPTSNTFRCLLQAITKL